MEKISIAELLKDCPRGMELYSPLFGKVKFDIILSNRIYVTTERRTCAIFNEYGANPSYPDSECLLFPSKGNRGWSTFQRPI